MTYKPPTDVESVEQLIAFHNMQPNPPDFGAVSNDRLRNLAMRSMLIDKDPAAADGHEEAMHIRADTLTIRQLIHEVWRSRRTGSFGRIERDPATALAQYNAVNSRQGDEG
jgi:hypothetical protein